MKRILTALVLIPLFLGSLLAPHPGFFGAFVAVAILLAGWELGRIAQATELEPFRKTLALLAAAFLLPVAWPDVFTVDEVLAAGLLILLILGLFRRADLGKTLVSASVTLFGALYVGFLLAYILRLRLERGGVGLVFLLALGVWPGDSLAYYVGKAFGKHKLNERVSPKKTWEGAAANVAGGLLGVAVGKVLGLAALEWVDVAVLGLIFPVFGMMGDLFESALKRKAGVKDSSGLLPGHGGVLDRLDSVFFNGPILFYYHQAILA
ncbi:MAG: phosphatidate cytidylyltransferase [Acidobacteriota bacterium]